MGLSAPSLASVVLVGACSNSAPTTSIALRDTAGATFQYTCDQGGNCNISPTGSTPMPPDCGSGTPVYAYTWARFIEICAASEHGDTSGLTGAMCRIVACSSDSDCPTIEGTSFSCVDALCQSDAGDRVAAVDAVLLCVGSAPRPTSCQGAAQDPTYVGAEAKVNASCPGALQSDPYSQTCTVPPGCMQP